MALLALVLLRPASRGQGSDLSNFSCAFADLEPALVGWSNLSEFQRPWGAVRSEFFRSSFRFDPARALGPGQQPILQLPPLSRLKPQHLNLEISFFGGMMTQQEPGADSDPKPFQNGSEWVRADFHLHTRADKEFVYSDGENSFVGDYVSALKKAGTRLGIITNHNKFNADEFKALRKKARKVGIGLLPGVELSVNDGANGVHTIVVFSDSWLADGHDYIKQFLGGAFKGRVPEQYEHENGRSNYDLLNTLKELEEFNRDFFVVFAHVENGSGLWNEIDGGRMQELAANPLIRKYCLGFQKVRTHDKKDAKCRVKVQGWWKSTYPAEVEGSDAKKIEDVGRGEKCFIKIGDFSFDAVKYALTDHAFRVSTEKNLPKVAHSHVNAVRFEGGLLNGVRVPFSPNLNCLIGIQGSGKSSVLESIRYALTIPFGDKPQDKEYKEALVPYVLKSGGKVIVEATDRHGTRYEVSRILNHQPDVHVDGKLRSGVSIRETVVHKPLYFGQKDLSAAGKSFGHDLVEKLVGESLKPVRQKIQAIGAKLRVAAESLLSLHEDAEEKLESDAELKDVNFRLEQFDKHKVESKLAKQVEFSAHSTFCESVDEIADDWQASLTDVVEQAEETLAEISVPKSTHSALFFKKYAAKLESLKKSVHDAKKLAKAVEVIKTDLANLHDQLDTTKDGLKEEFAEVERQLVKALHDQGVTSIQPNDYVALKENKAALVAKIADLEKKTSKEKTKRDALLKVLSEENEAWLEEFKQISTALNKINQAQESLKVQPVFKGDKTAFRDKMEEVFAGRGIRKETYLTLSAKYEDFAEIFKDLDNAASTAKSKTQDFKELFLENLSVLLSYQVPNNYDIAYRGKPLKSHSLGQRASAMMLFLLSQDDNDLLMIDQPEDDLDSQTVYEEVVKLLRAIKTRQQFIFVTHNANFPVLGDAENVAACHAEDDVIAVTSGSIDTKESQSKIVKIMEGGEEAFERRKSIYQIWSVV